MFRSRSIALLAVASLLVGACSSSAAPSTAPPATQAPAAAASSASGGSAGSGSLTNATLLIGGQCKIIYLPAELAYQLGYYKDAGLNVSIISQGANGGAVAGDVLTGGASAAVSFYDHSIDLQGAGKSTEIVAVMDQVPGEVVLVRTSEAAKVTSAADFGGLKLGVTSLSGSGAFLMKYLSKQAGVPLSSITLVQGGAEAAFVAAMQHGSFDVGMTNDPAVTEIVNQGIGKVLMDMRTVAGTKAALGTIYPAGSLYAATDFVQAHPDIIQGLTTGVVRALQYVHSHTAQQIAAQMPKDCYGSSETTYVQALNANLGMYTTNGLMPADGPQDVLTVLKAFDPNVEGKTIDLSKTYTNQFAQKADSSQ